tara:strand:+ start:323 stop:1117 length:795 start_codon:yes stop_codon:yes gene_type:complete
VTVKLLPITSALIIFIATSVANAFDHSHNEFDLLLKKHVVWKKYGFTSTVNYFGFEQDQAALVNYLKKVGAISEQQFESFNKQEQLAFLINAYNAYTVFWVSQNHRDIDSIKELGTLFKSPWKAKRFDLFGNIVSLDFIEHQLLREPGRFDDPRIHMAVNCASVSCPALRPEAYDASRINEQLNDSTLRFLSDRSRNSLKNKTLFISPIFKWYQTDFMRKSGSVLQWLQEYEFTLNPKGESFSSNSIVIKYTKYDWSLNNGDWE